jgi:glycolate oxidase iron-sulfur subunit
MSSTVPAGGVEAIVMNASGCGVTVKEYGHILRDDPAYADKAARISALTRDLSELLPELVPLLRSASVAARAGRRRPTTRRARCSTARSCAAGSKSTWALGFRSRRARNESHLCCGSAGTYSVLQPDSRCNCATASSAICRSWRPSSHRVANIGCITHLQSGTAGRSTPVRHWVELLDE